MSHAPAKPMSSRSSGALKGTASIPGDKSISHRALILGAMAVGRTHVTGLLEGQDVLDTAKAMQAFGATVARLGQGEWTIDGVPYTQQPVTVALRPGLHRVTFQPEDDPMVVQTQAALVRADDSARAVFGPVTERDPELTLLQQLYLLVPAVEQSAAGLVRQIDFNKTVLNGMLGFLLFALHPAPLGNSD